MGEKVEGLEYHPDLLPNLADISLRQADIFSADGDPATIYALKAVDRTQDSAFA
jgi:hypothetical protein